MAKQHFEEVFQFEKVTDKEIGANDFNVVGAGDAAYLRVPTSIGIVAAHKGDWLAKGDNGWHVYHDDPRKETIPAHAGEPQEPKETADKAVVSKAEIEADAQQPDEPAEHPVIKEPVKAEKPKKSRTTNQPLSAIGEQTGKQP